jgi:hypothetical protein
MPKRAKRKDPPLIVKDDEYDDKTLGDEKDQDSEETLGIQSDARENVEPRAPALRTRGAPARRDADTREDAGVKLDDPNAVEE